MRFSTLVYNMFAVDLQQTKSKSNDLIKGYRFSKKVSRPIRALYLKLPQISSKFNAFLCVNEQRVYNPYPTNEIKI